MGNSLVKFLIGSTSRQRKKTTGQLPKNVNNNNNNKQAEFAQEYN